MDPDPKFRDFAASILDEFPWMDLDVRRAREKMLARRLELIANVEVSDLRQEEARRIVREQTV